MKTKWILFLAVLAAALSATALPKTSQAEIAVWPGNVIAPFVHVQWNGQYVHVCAPFVNLTVDLPHRCCGCASQAYHEPCESTEGQTALRSYSAPTRRELARSANSLFQALESLETADSWQEYLAVAPGETLAAVQSANQPDAAIERDQLIKVLRHFDAANQDRQYRQITQLPEFRTTHAMLANYLARQPRPASSASEMTSVSITSTRDFDVPFASRAIDTARLLPEAMQSIEKQQVSRTAEELPPSTQHGGI